MSEKNNLTDKMRIVQESVPGKQITIAHIIANPDVSLYKSVKISGENVGAIGIITLCPAETAIIAGDIAIKAAGVKIAHMDYSENGTLVVTGAVSEVQSALDAVVSYCEEKLGFDVCGVTKT